MAMEDALLIAILTEESRFILENVNVPVVIKGFFSPGALSWAAARSPGREAEARRWRKPRRRQANLRFSTTPQAQTLAATPSAARASRAYSAS